MTPRAVIFDWAGTLIDPGCRAPVAAFQAAFANHGVALDEALVRRDMGLGKRAHTEILLAEPDVVAAFRNAHGRPPAPHDADALYEAVGGAMRQAAAAHTEAVPGAAAMLAALRAKGVRIGSTTGYPRAVMDVVAPAARALGVDPEVIVCAEEVRDPRPGPGQIEACLTALGLEGPDRVVKVDDSVSGLMEGRAAGCLTVAVTRSGNPLAQADLARWADAWCDSVADLAPCLARL